MFINKFSVLFLFFLSIVYSLPSDIRSLEDSSGRLWVAVDLKLQKEEYITDAYSNEKGHRPSFVWKNAKVIKEILPVAGAYVPPTYAYTGYDKDFTVLFHLEREDKTQLIECELFYVVCGNACRPVFEKFTIAEADNRLTQEEVNTALSKEKGVEQSAFLFIILLTFIGGIILNCMPCVLPIISLKILSIIKNSNNTRSSIIREGIYFSLGVITTFVAIGLTLLFLKNTGKNLGWGFYMQSPVFLVCLLLLFLFSALYFFGIIKTPNIKVINKFEYFKSFSNGVLTSVFSGICVGPFIGIPVALAMMWKNIFQSLSILVSLGLGVAFPFLLASFIDIRKFLPKPGRWMEIFKEFMGFSMLFSCLLLVPVLIRQLSSKELGGSVFNILFVVLCLAFFAWMFMRSGKSKTIKIIAVLSAFATTYFIFFNDNNNNDQCIEWREFSIQDLEKLKAEKKPVFINFTASWCLTCKYNEHTFQKKEVIEMFEKNGVITMKADWSEKNDNISKFLETLGYNSVPLYVLYKPNSNKPVIFSTLIRAEDIIKELGQEYEKK